MIFRPHPRQARFMAEPTSRIIIAGVGRPSGRRLIHGCWSEIAFAHDATCCRRPVEFVRQAPADATGLAGIDMRGIRPCGGRLIDGKCEFCDVTTIEDGR